MTRQRLSHPSWMKQTWEKTQESESPLFAPQESHENTAMETTILARRPWRSPAQPCTCCCHLWVQMSFAGGDRGPVSLVSSNPSGSYILSASCSVAFPELWGQGFDENIPFRDEHSKVFLCMMSGCGCLYFFPSPAGGLLIKAEQGTDIGVYQNIVRSHFIIFFSFSFPFLFLSFF